MGLYDFWPCLQGSMDVIDLIGGTMGNGRKGVWTVWRERHAAAMRRPCADFEEGLVGIFGGWVAYAEAYREAFESGISNDYVLGPEWARVGRGLLGLLNGPTGRLDCGTLDGAIREALDAHGIEEDGE